MTSKQKDDTMNVMKRISGFFKAPENLNTFNIPVLYKQEESTYSYGGRVTHTNYIEAYTDGFYYIKDGIKYYHVKEKNKEPVYFKQNSLVFLSEEETDASRTVDP